MDTLSVAEVNEMIASGDIDFERFKKLASDAKATTRGGLGPTDDQIKMAIGRQRDDDDEEFVGHLLNILGSEVLEDEEEE